VTRPGVLLHVGFHKAGSSWLEAWLTRHPQIRFLAGTFGGHGNPIDVCRQVAKESSDTRWVAMSEENWTGGLVFPEGYFYLLLRHQGFHRRPPTIRAHQERLADELATLFPHARVLVITRGFAAALRSVYSQVVRIGGDLSFLDFLHEYELPIEAWLHYDHVIETYRARFGADQVTVLPFEALAAGEDAFIAILEEELGLDHAELHIGRVLPSLTTRQLAAYSRFSRRVLGPVARHLRNYRAMQLYLLYARFVVDRPWSDAVVQSAFGRSANAAVDPVPPSYLERFRGSATTLAALPRFAPYRAAYLLDAEGGA
jgi:hypothetical protein